MSKVLTFEQAVQAALDGKELQFEKYDVWHDSIHNGNMSELIVQLGRMHQRQWRIKPDVFKEVLSEHLKSIPLSNGPVYVEGIEAGFKAGWDARGEHKDDENI